MTEIEFVMWNCSGVLPSVSTKEKLDFLEITTKNKFDILILVETHHKEEDKVSPQLLRLKNTHHMIHTKANDKDPYAGIIIFIHKSFDITHKKELVPGRMLNTKIKHGTTGKKMLHKQIS